MTAEAPEWCCTIDSLSKIRFKLDKQPETGHSRAGGGCSYKSDRNFSRSYSDSRRYASKISLFNQLSPNTFGHQASSRLLSAIKQAADHFRRPHYIDNVQQTSERNSDGRIVLSPTSKRSPRSSVSVTLILLLVS